MLWLTPVALKELLTQVHTHTHTVATQHKKTENETKKVIMETYSDPGLPTA